MDRKVVGTLVLVLGLLFTGGVGVATADTPVASEAADGADAPVEFEVDIVEVTTPVEGETVDVTVDVANVGAAGEGSVTAAVGALGTDTAAVSLDAGESATVTLRIETDIEDTAGSPYMVTVTSEADVATATVDVTLPVVGAADQSPQDLNRDGHYEDIAGDGEFTIFDVQAFFNSFNGAAIQSHAWAFNFNEDDDISIFDVQALFTKLQAGIDESGFFEVSITGIDDEVGEGDPVTVAYEVTNTGPAAETQDITFEVGGSVEDSETVSLDVDESATGEFTHETETGDAPGLGISVSSADDLATAPVRVIGEASFEVSITDVPESVAEGETVTVAYEVENTGGVTDTQTVEFAVDGELEGTEEDVSLDGGETFDGEFSYDTVEGDTPGVNLTVSSDDDEATGTVAVLEPAAFAVDITEVPAEVAEGTELVVAYEVENVGEAGGEQDIEFAVDGDLEGTEADVTLAGGETFDDEFVYATEIGDAPAVEVTVSSEDDEESAAVTVTEEAIFAVSIGAFDESVLEGETATVEYEVTNTGDDQQTQDITFSVEGAVEDTEADVSLAGGETFEGTFTYETSAEDVPEILVEVSSEDDTADRSIAVLEPASFAVSITEVDDEVVEGESVTVAYEVENTGDAEDTQDITFAVDDAIEATETDVSLDGGESFDGTFSYETVEGDTPEVTVTVASEDDDASETVTVLSPATFAVSITEVEDEVVEGETVTVAYEVENTGGVSDTQTVAFVVDGTTEATEEVTLDGSETFTDAFSYETSADDVPEIAVEVSSADDTASETVTVLSPATFAVSITEVDDEVVEGETVTVAYEVENTGDAEDTQTVEFAVDGDLEETETDVSLDGGETFAGEFSYETDGGDVPDIEVAVSSEDDTATATVAVLSPASFAVSITDVPASVEEGDEIAVAYEVENTGDVEDTQDITFEVDGTVEDTEAGVALDGGETFGGTFTHETEEGDGGDEVTVAVSSEDDSDSATVEIEVGTFDLLAELSDETGTVGETVSVDLDVTSIEGEGDEFGSYTIVLSYDESVMEFTELDPGEWGSPASVNDGEDGAVAVTDFAASGTTPVEPALTFEFELVGAGSSAVVFDDDVDGIPGQNEINDGDGTGYQVTFEDGSAGTTSSTDRTVSTERPAGVSVR